MCGNGVHVHYLRNKHWNEIGLSLIRFNKCFRPCTTTIMNTSNKAMFVEPCLNAFKSALEEIKPSSCVQTALHLRSNQLSVNGRTYHIKNNVHLVAIGKAAPGMVEGAENVIKEHFNQGIASVPSETLIPQNLRTQFLTGAKNNLPDEQAVQNVKKIEQFIQLIKNKPGEQLILFLISGGGSALLPAPIQGISLDDKIQLIQLLQRNGADIRQLNVVRTALSRLKGGGLARLGHPAKMISLIISDIVGDPLELISSGPTVIPTKVADPIAILNELNVKDKVSKKVLNALEKSRERHQAEEHEGTVDVHNVIVASNAKMLEALARKLDAGGFTPLIITNQLEGDASELGIAMAKLLMRLLKTDELTSNEIKQCFGEEGNLLFDKNVFNLDEQLSNYQSDSRQPLALLFGGESTVRFNKEKVQEGAKGGRNQELVLAAFNAFLIGMKDKQTVEPIKEFSLYSLGTDGQDGPTDATGAYIDSSSLSKTLRGSDFPLFLHKVNDALEGKNSYIFWSDFNGGKNLIKTGKTGMNVMDVQIILIYP